MKKTNELYTVIVLPDPTAKPYRFKIRKKTARFLAGSLSVAVLIISGLLTHYVILMQDRAELKTLRKETVVQKRQVQDFAAQITDFKKQMVRLKEMDAKLRIMTDINPPSQTAVILGMGGTETRGLSDIEMGISPEQLAVKMDEEVKILKAEAARQEVSFEELVQDMKERRTLWESTPSIWPVKGWLSSGFGKRISPFTGRVMMHKGIDVATRQNTLIIATADGLVNHIGYHSRLGRLVKINHGHGVQTLYGHLAKVEVRSGQRVKRGDVIGLVGNTGVSTGPHVHYGVFVNGLPVNPLRYIIN